MTNTSPFSHPDLVMSAMQFIRSDSPTHTEVPLSYRSTVRELIEVGLAEEVATRRGGRGSWIHRVRLTDAGEKRLRAAMRAAKNVASAPLPR